MEAIQREMQEVQEEAGRKAQVLQEKQDIIDMVMLEVEKIRDQQESDKRNTQEKDAVIEEMGNQIEMLSRQSDTKGEEIRTLIEKMEAYKRQKD